MLDAIVGFVKEATPLSSIERALAEGDPMIVRAAVFTLLHAGRLRAPCLHTEALSLLTPFLPVAHRP